VLFRIMVPIRAGCGIAPDFTAEERYVRHQRGLFVAMLPRTLTASSAVSVGGAQPLVQGKALLQAPAPQAVLHPQQPAQLQDVQRDLHSVVRSLQRQVDELQDMVRSLQQPASEAERSSTQASPSTNSLMVARTPSEEALLQMYRQRRSEESPEVPSRPRQQSKESRESLGPEVQAQENLVERRRQVPKRSWSLGTCGGPNLWQVLQHRLGLHQSQEVAKTTQLSGRRVNSAVERATSTAGGEVTRNMSWRETAQYIYEDLQTRYGCLEVAATSAALALNMCSEHDVNSCLVQLGDGEKGIRATPLSKVAGHLPSISFGAQAFEDALLDVLQVGISRKCARRLFRLLAAVPRPTASIGSGVGSSAELPQLAQPELWAVEEPANATGVAGVQKPEVKVQIVQRPGNSARASSSRSPERRESKLSSGRGSAAGEVTASGSAPPRKPGGVQMQEHVRRHWQHGLRSDAEPQPVPPAAMRKPSLTSQRSASGSTLAPPARGASMSKRDGEARRRELSLQSLLDFEAEVRARQEHASSATSSDHEPQREPPASSPRPAENRDSPLRSHRLRAPEHQKVVKAQEGEMRPQVTGVEMRRAAPAPPSLEAAIPATWQNRRRSI